MGLGQLKDKVRGLGEDLDRHRAPEPPTGLPTTRRILHTCKGSTLQGQWDPLRQHVDAIHQVLIPAVLRPNAASARSTNPPHPG